LSEVGKIFVAGEYREKAKTIPPEQRNAVSSDLLSKKSNYFKRSFLNSGGNHPALQREMLLLFFYP
jgi:hypothetical protein